jgi:hypothetical protein
MLGRIDAWSASIQVQGESGGIGAVCRHPLAAEETRSVGAVRRVSPLFPEARVPLSPAVRLQVALTMNNIEWALETIRRVSATLYGQHALTGDQETADNLQALHKMAVVGLELCKVMRITGAKRTGTCWRQNCPRYSWPATGPVGITRARQRSKWIVHQMGHAWSGGVCADRITTSKGPNASAEMVRFFSEHPHGWDQRLLGRSSGVRAPQTPQRCDHQPYASPQCQVRRLCAPHTKATSTASRSPWTSSTGTACSLTAGIRMTSTTPSLCAILSCQPILTPAGTYRAQH